MSFPTIPNITPAISISFQDTINLLLSSIAFEELALAHIMNAEAEKIQYVLGTLSPSISPTIASVSDLLAVNSDVRKTLQSVIKKEMLLQFKLENVLELIPAIPPIAISDPPRDCAFPTEIAKKEQPSESPTQLS